MELGRQSPPTTPDTHQERAARIGVPVDSGARPASIVDRQVRRGVAQSAGSHLLHALHDAAVGSRLLPLLRRPQEAWIDRRHLAAVSRLLPDILPAIPALPETPPPATWTVHRIVGTVTDMVVFLLGPPGQAPAAVLKLPQTDQAVLSSRRQWSLLAALQADGQLGEWRTLLPECLAEGEVNGRVFVVERCLPGLDARALLSRTVARARLLGTAATTIGELHRRTAAVVVVDAGMLERWIDRPLLAIRRATATYPRVADNERALERLARELHAALAGRTMSVSWIHGDFTPGNILAIPDGATLTGIVDWELAAPDELPLLDVLQLLLSIRMCVQRRELGDLMRAHLHGEEWTPQERELLAAAQAALPGDEIGMRALLLLCWLRHIAANLTKSTRYAGHWLWMKRNVEAVLEIC